MVQKALKSSKTYVICEVFNPKTVTKWGPTNDDVMNEEDDEVEGSIRSLPTEQIKISIQLSFHDIVFLYICLYSFDVL